MDRVGFEPTTSAMPIGLPVKKIIADEVGMDTTN
jgi:hypothetical protein